jgi:hypothetical protein
MVTSAVKEAGSPRNCRKRAKRALRSVTSKRLKTTLGALPLGDLCSGSGSYSGVLSYPCLAAVWRHSCSAQRSHVQTCAGMILQAYFAFAKGAQAFPAHGEHEETICQPGLITSVLLWTTDKHSCISMRAIHTHLVHGWGIAFLAGHHSHHRNRSLSFWSIH